MTKSVVTTWSWGFLHTKTPLEPTVAYCAPASSGLPVEVEAHLREVAEVLTLFQRHPLVVILAHRSVQRKSRISLTVPWNVA